MTPTEEDIVFHFQLGKAIAAWARVEEMLGLIFCGCFDKSIHWKSVSVGLFSITGFRAKLDFVEAAVLRRFPAHEPQWSKLVQKLRSTSEQRNKLAHWPVRKYLENAQGRRFVLSKWLIEKSKKSSGKPKPPNGSLGLLDLWKLEASFIGLSQRAENFVYHLKGKKEPHAINPAQLMNPPTIAKLRAQILGGLERQQ